MKENKVKKSLKYDFADEIVDQNNKYDFIQQKVFSYEKCHVIQTTILNDNNIFNKKRGIYYSIEFQSLNDKKTFLEVSETIQKIVSKLIKLKLKSRKKKILIVGLGNEEYAPDSLGPRVAKEINVTFHLDDTFVNQIASFVPLVKGVTGLESFDVIKNIVRFHNFDIVICIDSLATSSLDRLNKVIQITDTGIIPGSGISNYRKELSSKSLGIPIIVIGIGTVIPLKSIVYSLCEDINKIDSELVDAIENEKNNMIFALKDIDKQMMVLVKLISYSLNNLLCPKLLSSFDK
ncbi:MAG: GPR endopeptidase [Bacilli bacterium]